MTNKEKEIEKILNEMSCITIDDISMGDVLSYINRLKSEIKENEREMGKNWKLICQAKQRTASEIFNMWYNEEIARLNIEYAKMVKGIAKEYGVEVDE